MLVYFAIILVVLLGFCGLAIDVGRMELRTNQLQAAVDAAALAAAGELWHGGTGSDMQTAANNDAAAVESANAIPSTGAPTLQIGPSSGPYVGDHSTVQATITQNFPTVFLGLLKANASITLSVTAIAQIPPCAIFLGNPTYGSTFDFWIASAGNQTPNSYTCPEYFNDGLVIDGYAHVYGSQIRSSGKANASVIQGGTTWPIVYSVPQLSNPLSYIPTPSPPSCPGTAPISKLNQPTSSTINLTPGTYCGSTNQNPTFIPGPGAACGQTASKLTPAIDIEGSWSGCPTQGGLNGNDCTTKPTVNFSPGMYVFVGGINFTCANVIGTGVTMYFTNTANVGYGLMHVTCTQWNVSAPNDASGGGIAGISIMNDPAWTGGTQDFQLVYSSYYADGVIYLRGTGLDAYSLNMNAPNYLNIVAPNMYSYDANVNLYVNYANLPAGNPLHTTVSLVQ